jgi:glycosyltransferase involved in cell wall biosynthesis
VDLGEFAPRPGEAAQVRARFGLEGKFVVSCVGTHGVLHRLDLLLDVAERLRDRPRFHVLFVGDGAERPRLEEAARGRRLVNVSSAGLQPRDAVCGFYSASDVCYVPLRPDPFLYNNFVPSKILEILAAGTRILGCVGGEAAEILQASGLARVVPPGDVDGIVAALIGMEAQPFGVSTRAAGRDFAQGWSREMLARRCLEFLSQLSSRRAAR